MTLPPFHIFAADVLGLEPATRQAAFTFQKAFDGDSLDDVELALFQTYTGRETPRPSGYSYGVQITGRQGSKTEMGTARGAKEAVGASLQGLRDVAVVVIAQDSRAGERVAFQYLKRYFERPMLRPLVDAETADTITLRGGVRLIVLPCRAPAIRGLRCICVVLDELAHYRSSENVPLDRDIWRAALPTLLTTRGRMLGLTSPGVAEGLTYDLHRQHYGRDSDVLIWQSPSYITNPTLDDGALTQLRAVDADGATAEIDGEFLRGASTLLDVAVLADAVDEGVTARPPVGGVMYVAACDVATGTKSSGDAWTSGISHYDRASGASVLDALLVVRPPFSPATAAAATAALCRSYGVTAIRGDRFAAGFTSEGFARVGLHYEPAPMSKSDAYLQLATALQSGTVRLLDHPDLLKELRGLTRWRGPMRDRVDHQRGAHDDVANVAALAVAMASTRINALEGKLTW